MPHDTPSLPRLGRAIVLRNGVCVRLRLVHFSDIGAIAELIERHGAPTTDLTAERLVQSDPRRRYVICAMALMEGAEQLVGLAALDLAPAPDEPEVLICSPGVGEDLPGVLRDVLAVVARATARADAA